MLVALLLAAAAQEVPAKTITLSEMQAAEGPDAAMASAERILPQPIRARVIEGKIHKSAMPWPAYWIRYREPARAAARDMCAQRVHTTEAKSLTVYAANASPTTELTLTPVETRTEVAALPPGKRATRTTCAAAKGYILQGPAPYRPQAAYRVLVAVMEAARGKSELPFRLTCRSDKEAPAACDEPRAALATLPVEHLLRIDISCLEENRYREGASINCRPLKAGAPYRATAAFGMSPPDGRSWHVEFVHGAGWPDEVALQRTLVIYH